MNQQYLFEPIPCDKYDLLTKDELIELHKGEQDLARQLAKRVKFLEAEFFKGQQKSFSLKEQLFNIKNKLFGRSSEKSEKPKKDKPPKKKDKKKTVRLPSERYKNLDVVEKDVEHDQVPNCPSCESQMQDSGLVETSEYLTFIPRKYYVVREKRHKYRCKCCQSALVTTPPIPRLIPGGAYSDEMIIDAAMSKFLDLIPIDRYRNIAARAGLENLPANSLINTTHRLADEIEPAYRIIKEEVFESEVIHADETPHRMLEGDKKNKWYLWGFSNETSSYFELHDTRSGDVASDLLVESNCKYLMSDVFSGYSKAVKDANVEREKLDKPKIEHLYCNAHARRKYKGSAEKYDETEFFTRLYKRIYRLESEQLKTPLNPQQKRDYQNLYMRVMRRKAEKLKGSYPKDFAIEKAWSYFLNNFDSFARFTIDPKLPIDNNHEEREMRPPVVGRKTWLGTHSKRGARTTEIMFSIVQSCKLNKVNPREYLKALVRDLLQGKPAFSPRQYKERLESSS